MERGCPYLYTGSKCRVIMVVYSKHNYTIKCCYVRIHWFTIETLHDNNNDFFDKTIILIFTELVSLPVNYVLVSLT